MKKVKITILKTTLDKELAAEYGTRVESAELIGLMPMRALSESAAHYLGIRDFDAKERVIEEFLF